mmetsp:Transcript_14290/g.21460  ORF Transcript_14290/g.21460 Transcript_14290/m.21460 type:complete len:116 (-) Transcript_14290:226-573(-)
MKQVLGTSKESSLYKNGKGRSEKTEGFRSSLGPCSVLAMIAIVHSDAIMAEAGSRCVKEVTVAAPAAIVTISISSSIRISSASIDVLAGQQHQSSCFSRCRRSCHGRGMPRSRRC